MAMTPGKGMSEAQCPHCGSGLAKSPAGIQMLQRASQAMARPPASPMTRAMGRPPMPMAGGGMPGGMARPGMAPGGAPGLAGAAPQDALRRALLAKIMQARLARGGVPPTG